MLIDNNFVGGNYVTISVPWINMNVFTMLTTEHKLIETKTFRVKRDLFKQLLMRLQIGSSTKDDLVAYSRSLA